MRRLILAAAMALTSAPAFADPITSTWNGGTNNWTTAANWSPSINYPDNGNGASTYDAVISSGTVTLDQDITIQKLTLSGGTFTGALPFVLTLNDLATMSGGTLAGSANWNVASSLSWTAGTMSGTGQTTIGSGDTLSMSGTSHNLQRLLVNNGTATWTSGDMPMNGGTFQNNGSFTANSNSLLDSYSSGTASAFNNVGTFTKLGTGITQLRAGNQNLAFNNTGTVDVQAGSLRLLSGGTHTGDFSIAAGTSLWLEGTHSFAATTDISGTGTFNVNAGTTTFDGQQNAAGTFAIGSGTANFNGATTAGALNLSSGTLSGTGTVTFAGTSTWTAGTMSGTGQTTIGSGGTLSMSGTSHNLQRLLVNNGTATWTSGDMPMNGGTFQNNGSFTANSNSLLDSYSSGTASAFNNVGTFTKLGTGITQLRAGNQNLAFNNTGTVDVQAGSLRLLSGGTHTGDFSIAAGTSLWLEGTHSFAATTDISGTGTFNVNAGTTTFDGQQNAAGTFAIGSGTANFNGATTAGALNLSSGTLSGTGTVTFAGTSTWTAGTMSGTGQTTIGSGGTLSMSGTSHNLQRLLVNNGTATWTSGDMPMNGGTFQNNGSFTANSSATLDNYGSPSGVNAFNNAGTFTKQGTGTTQFRIASSGVAFNNSGTVDVQAGTLRLGAGGSHTGDFLVASGAVLELIGAHTFLAPAEVNGAGTFEIETGATINGELKVNGVTTSVNDGSIVGSENLTIETGTLAWSAGTMSGTGQTVIEGAASLTINGGTTHQLNRPLVNDGVATWTSANVSMNNGTFQNNGSFTSNSTGTRTFFSVGGTNAFNNAGTFIKANTGTTEFDVASTGVVFNNTGAVDVQAGTLRLESGVTQHVGTQLTGGKWRIGAGATLNITTGSNITTNLGDVTLDGIGSTFAKINALVDNQGSFTILNGRNFSAAGAFSNTGFVEVGAGSTFTAPALSQHVGSVLTGGTWHVGGTLSVTAGANITTNQGNIRLDGPSSTFDKINSLVDNQGLFAILNGRNFGVSAGPFSNTNSVIIGNGSTLHLSSLSQINAGQLTGGGWYIGPNGMLQIDIATDITTNLAAVTLDGAGSTFSKIDSLVNNYGAFEILSGRNFIAQATFNNHGALKIGALSTFTAASGFTQHSGAVLNGSGTLAGNLTNSGTLAPGNSPGIIHIQGDYTQTPTGVLEIEIGGRDLDGTPGVDFDQVQVSGHSTLGGAITFPFVNGYVPQTNDEVTFLTSGSISGAPKSLSAPDLENANPNLGFVVFKNPQDLRIRFVPATDIHVAFVDNTVTTINYDDAAKWEDDASTHRVPTTADKVDLNRAQAPFLQRVEVTSADAAAYQLSIHDSSSPITLGIKNNYTLSAAVGSVTIGQNAVVELGTAGNPSDGGTLAAPSTKTVTLQQGGMLKGNGTVSAQNLIVSDGTVSPGFSVGHLELEGAYQQGASGTLRIDIEGSGVNQFDTIDISSVATLDGTLQIDASNLTTFTSGTMFPIMTAGSITGDFENVDWTGNNNVYFLASHDGTTAFAEIKFRGDMDGDDDIDNQDRDLFALGLVSPSRYFDECDCADYGQLGGDFSGNGRLDFEDIGGFSTASGLTAQEIGAAIEFYARSVPEPSSTLLAVVGTLGVALYRRRQDGRKSLRSAAFCRRIEQP